MEKPKASLFDLITWQTELDLIDCMIIEFDFHFYEALDNDEKGE